MTWGRTALRAVGLVGALAGVLDPGCTTTRRPVMEVVVLDGTTEADSLVTRLSQAAPWADLRRSPPADNKTQAGQPASARLLVGDAGAVLTALRERGADLVVEPAGDALSLTGLVAPTRVAVGTTTDILARVAAPPGRTGRVRVVLRDLETGVDVGQGEAAVGAAPARGEAQVRVPWVPVRSGGHRLRASAQWTGKGAVRMSPPADVDVDAQRLRVTVDVLEARPSWSARFARLALEGADGVVVRNETRVAPGLVAGAESAPVVNGAGNGAALSIVGGVDALTGADVARLLGDVSERGRTVVLVLDDAPGAGPWTRLWPGRLGAVRSASTARTARVGPHRWHVREWLAPPSSTDARPLAYLDEGTAIVWGRAAGAGRVVLVSALDAWRWRADADTDFAAGWRALVTSLAIDSPRPLALQGWLGQGGDGRVVGLSVAAAPGTALDEVRVTAGTAVGADGRDLRLWAPGPGQWRGVAPWPAGATATFVTTGLRAGQVVAQDTAVIQVSPPALVAAWSDVVRHQASVGAMAATAAEAPRALSAMQAALQSPPGPRWYVTRTWWYAAMVLAALGTEWILRRLHRER